jgi:hypothetical protein
MIVPHAVFECISHSAIDIIFIFSNNTRISGRRTEQKTNLSVHRLAGFFKGTFFPIVRTKSVETLAVIPPIGVSITRTTIRKIVSFGAGEYKDAVRVVCDKRKTELGTKCYISFEIEYPASSTWNEILIWEDCLMQVTTHHLRNLNLCMQRSPITKQDLFSCIPSKLQNWDALDPTRPYVWAYKWDGVKCKYVILNKETILWPDARDIWIEPKLEHPIVKYLQDVCLQAELLNDKLVLIEAMTIKHEDNFFAVDLNANYQFMQYLSRKCKKYSFSLSFRKIPFSFQQYYESPLPTQIPAQCDGLVILQEGALLKWKMPTLDVLRTETGSFVVINADSPSSYENVIVLGDTSDCVAGKIYEIAPDRTILRERCDRLVPDTLKEYQIFCNSCLMINVIEKK